MAALLRGHPGLQLSRVKEVHHFDDEARVDWSAPVHARLHEQFDWSTQGVLRGEATPIYVYWPQALFRLSRYNPDARLILALRHPTFRSFSHWRMEHGRGKDGAAFSDAVSAEGRRRVAEAPGGVHRVYSYIERSLYAPQIERLLALFPRSQVHFFRTDRLWNEPAATLSDIERFLGVEPALADTAQRRYVVPLATDRTVALSAPLRDRLDETFRADIVRTCELTGLDLRDWLRPDYEEPMRQGGD